MRNIQLIVVLKSVLKAATLSFPLLIALSLSSFSSFADTQAIQDKGIPNKGMTQSQVTSTYGEPLSTKAPIGKPPIARWDYTDYSVYFEGNYVIHSFHHNQRKQATTPKPMAEGISSEKAAMEIPTPSDVNHAETTPKAPAETPLVEEVETEAVEEEVVAEEVATDEEAEPEVIVEVAPDEEAEPEVIEEREKDLNFEEPEKKADYGKWGY